VINGVHGSNSHCPKLKHLEEEKFVFDVTFWLGVANITGDGSNIL